MGFRFDNEELPTFVRVCRRANTFRGFVIGVLLGFVLRIDPVFRLLLNICEEPSDGPLPGRFGVISRSLGGFEIVAGAAGTSNRGTNTTEPLRQS